MVKEQVDKKQQAADEFALYLTKKTLDFDWECEISAALKDLAVKYNELSPSLPGFASLRWHDYFVLGLKKFVRDLPSTIPDLKKALAALHHDEVEAEPRPRGVNIQTQPGPPANNDKTPKAPASHENGMDKTPKAPAPSQNGNQNAHGKRPAENRAEGKSSAATEAQDRPTKRVKHGGEDTTTSSGFTVETEGSMSLTFRISDDARTSTFNLNGRGPAVVTVNVQKKATTALASTSLASANGNKEAKKEGEA